MTTTLEDRQAEMRERNMRGLLDILKPEKQLKPEVISTQGRNMAKLTQEQREQIKARYFAGEKGRTLRKSSVSRRATSRNSVARN